MRATLSDAGHRLSRSQRVYSTVDSETCDGRKAKLKLKAERVTDFDQDVSDAIRQGCDGLSLSLHHITNHHHTFSLHHHNCTMIATAMLPRVALRSAFSVSRTLPLRRGFATSRVDLANTLIFLEHKKGNFAAATLSALTAAQKLGGDIDALVVGG